MRTPRKKCTLLYSTSLWSPLRAYTPKCLLKKPSKLTYAWVGHAQSDAKHYGLKNKQAVGAACIVTMCVVFDLRGPLHVQCDSLMLRVSFCDRYTTTIFLFASTSSSVVNVCSGVCHMQAWVVSCTLPTLFSLSSAATVARLRSCRPLAIE
eukprot:GHVQ01001645.1.p1 GENE.GHVQ01001645.1~~GHVQ01001645.1.p1  ORF type:complete len:151 (+),score=13.25 GHVQ01001645.1:391-843(+)